MEARGLRINSDLDQWVNHVTSSKVDPEDFNEVINELKNVQ